MAGVILAVLITTICLSAVPTVVGEDWELIYSSTGGSSSGGPDLKVTRVWRKDLGDSTYTIKYIIKNIGDEAVTGVTIHDEIWQWKALFGDTLLDEYDHTFSAVPTQEITKSVTVDPDMGFALLSVWIDCPVQGQYGVPDDVNRNNNHATCPNIWWW